MLDIVRGYVWINKRSIRERKSDARPPEKLSPVWGNHMYAHIRVGLITSEPAKIQKKKKSQTDRQHIRVKPS